MQWFLHTQKQAAAAVAYHPVSSDGHTQTYKSIKHNADTTDESSIEFFVWPKHFVGTLALLSLREQFNQWTPREQFIQ